MSALQFAEPLQTSSIGLIIEIFATDEVLQKISRFMPEPHAQNVARLIGDDLRTKMGVPDVAIVVAAGLLDEPMLADEELDIITAIEHVSEQFSAVHPDVLSIAMSDENYGLEGVQFPLLEPKNTDGLSSLSFCIPLCVVGTGEQLDRFEAAFYKDEKQHLHFSSDAVVHALTEAYDLKLGELASIGYDDLDYAAEAIGAFTTNAKLKDIAIAAKNGRQAYYSIKSVPVFVLDGKVRVGFFSFDAFARRLPHLTVGGVVEDAYAGFVKDYRFVLTVLEDEGLAPWCIHFPSPTEHTTWAEVAAAKRLDGLYVEDAATGLFEPAEGPAVSLDLVCMIDFDDGGILAATLTEMNDEDAPLRQINIYPVTFEGMEAVFDYAKAIAQRKGLNLDVSEGQGLYLNEERRVLSTPPLEGGSYDEVPATHLLH